MSPEILRRSVSTADPQQILARIWDRSLPLMRERLAWLNTAAQDAVAGRLTPQARTEAAALAHKLAGSLGMFGYLHGTELARDIEVLLEADDPVPASTFLRLTEQLTASLPL